MEAFGKYEASIDEGKSLGVLKKNKNKNSLKYMLDQSRRSFCKVVKRIELLSDQISSLTKILIDL